MNKKRFGLLTKIILLTGLLTILTVSASLIVGTLALQRNAQDIYIKSCQGETDYVESIFFPRSQDDNTKIDSTVSDTLDLLIDTYLTVREDYDQKTPEQLATYQTSVRVALFDPEPGSMGMTYEKSMRKSYYSNAVASILSLCSTFNIPSASVGLFDVGKQRLITLTDNSLSVEDNCNNIGLVGTAPTSQELNFYLNSSNDDNYRTMTVNNMVYSYNFVELATVRANYKCFVKAQFSLAETNESFNKQLITELITTVAAAVVLVAVYAVFAKLFLIRNVGRLTKSTNRFVSKMTNNEQLEVINTDIKTNDEIRELSDAFTVMQEQIISYVENIKKAKDIEQAFKTEVEIASKIQLESLPARTHFDRNLELRAFIEPAKGVGGDFYDYFYIDEDHLAVVIADVSGKGIPASLFMMRSKESLRSAAMNEKDLATVFYKVNNSLCVNNKEGFFVTAFLGVLNLKTFEFNYISAGHERPVIKHKGECKRMEVKSNFVLGLEEDFVYEEEKIKLNKEDTIILYTDGLNEAINANKEEFGYDRIKASLEKDNEPKYNIETVINDLKEFRGEEEQFDDITIVAFNIKDNVTTFHYKNPQYDDILDLTSKVEQCLEDLNPATVSKIGIVIDEVMNNIISYGRTKTNKTLTVSVEKTDDGATLLFADNSHPFNPLLKPKHTIPENMEKGIVGGVGISIVTSISKESEYTYSNNKNILVIKF